MVRAAPRKPPATAEVGLTAYLLVAPAAGAGSIAGLAVTRSLGWALVAASLAAIALVVCVIAWAMHLPTDTQ